MHMVVANSRLVADFTYSGDQNVLSLWTAVNHPLSCRCVPACNVIAACSATVVHESTGSEGSHCHEARNAASNRCGRVSVGSFSEASLGHHNVDLKSSSPPGGSTRVA